MPATTIRRRAPALLALATAALLAACGGGSPSGPATVTPRSAAAPTTHSPTSDPTSPDPSLTGTPLSPDTSDDAGKAGEDVTLRGTIEEGAESGCVVLVDASGGNLANLIGLPDGEVPAGEVEVTGQFVPDLMTTCQQGKPFQVESVRAAG